MEELLCGGNTLEFPDIRKAKRNMRGVGTGLGGIERPPGVTQGAAVHHHSLDRLNTINDSLEKKLKKRGT